MGKKMKSWRIDGTVDNTLYPAEQPILFSRPIKAYTVEGALRKLDPILHKEAAQRGWKRGECEIHTNETMEEK